MLTRRTAEGTGDLGCSSLGWPFLRWDVWSGSGWLVLVRGCARSAAVVSSCCATTELSLAVSHHSRV